MNINLEQLPLLSELFKKLNTGSHINKHLDNKLWIEVEKQEQSYQALFKALGFEFIVDARGFCFFNTEQSNSNTNKLTQRLALIMLLLFEFQANAGADLYRFDQWRIDNDFLNTIWQESHDLLEAEEINTLTDLTDVFDSGCRVGFIVKENNHYRLLAAVHRYLDLFIELQKSDKPDPIADEN